ncbi:DUF2510 domain-containing protein [Branchiibius sp. NY16-3462-2]|uniref:DUF2510 domain-containing protein n=1 Tax=Branchiibius sp. NY16-3462-2 TaxID=1807500 RepID=UPI000797C6D6|nr:DUF2510 domain-containing protein [Branchiibius sp. NY16-3462-2]KYH45322.1 hypothetical protein AZH51_05460 [Branchiibius sp. NY16-3462-2]
MDNGNAPPSGNGRQAPAGYYPDGAGNERFWDGFNWTEYVRPLAGGPQPQKRRGLKNLPQWGRVLLALLPSLSVFLSVAVRHMGNDPQPATSPATAVASSSAPTPAVTQSSPTVSDPPLPTDLPTGAAAHRMNLSAGKYVAGVKDIADGTYDVVPLGGTSGSLVVDSSVDDTDPPITQQRLGNDAAGSVQKVRVDLNLDNQIVVPAGLRVAFIPHQTGEVGAHVRTVLYAGTFIVGQDIGPGKYRVTAPGQAGAIDTFTNDPATDVDAVLGDGSELTKTSVVVQLTNDDEVDLTDMSRVIFTPVP